MDGNLIAETYVGVTNISYFVNNSCALVGLTYTYDKMHGTDGIKRDECVLVWKPFRALLWQRDVSSVH